MKIAVKRTLGSSHNDTVPINTYSRGLRDLDVAVARLDELEVRVLLGLLVIAARDWESCDLLAELVVVEYERGRRGVLLGLVLGEAVGRGCDQHEAQQDPGRATAEDAQHLLEA